MMLSRVAEDLYWFARYLRRAENTARLVSAHGHFLLDLPREVEVGWGPIVSVTGTPLLDVHLALDGGEHEAIERLLVNVAHPTSAAYCIDRARVLLRTLRDRVPREIWERLNDLHHYLQMEGGWAHQRQARARVLERILDTCLAISGLLHTATSRDIGHRFMALGQAIEQADMTSRILDVRSSPLLDVDDATAPSPFRNSQWMAVLHSLSAYQMYRRYGRGRITGTRVLRFLLQNPGFPRSVLFNLLTVRYELQALPVSDAPLRECERLLGRVRDFDPFHLVTGGLQPVMDEFQAGLAGVDQQLSHRYFELQTETTRL